MSTYAAIFMYDKTTNLYNGITVKYDGYIDGVGKKLFENWNDPIEIEKLCKGAHTDYKELGSAIKYSTWFDDEDVSRKLLFRNLTRDQMINEGNQYNYCYVYEPYEDANNEWFVKSSSQDQFDMLIDKFNNFLK